MTDPLQDRPGARLLGGAWAFLRAAELVHADDPKSLAWATCFANLAFAIELGLKGYLREQGLDEKQQRALGHNLKDALDKSVERGFRVGHPAIRVFVEDLSSHHQNMSLMYLIGNELELPVLRDAIKIVRMLLYDLHLQLIESRCDIDLAKSQNSLD